MPITLPPELEQFINNQVASGKYASTDEVFLAGIKLLQERENLNVQTYFIMGESNLLKNSDEKT